MISGCNSVGLNRVTVPCKCVYIYCCLDEWKDTHFSSSKPY